MPNLETSNSKVTVFEPSEMVTVSPSRIELAATAVIDPFAAPVGCAAVQLALQPPQEVVL